MAGNAETLRRYWAEGEGAAKIRWGDPGDWQRCVDHVSKFMPGQAAGYCNLLHKRALGFYPATHAKMGASHGTADLLEASVALGIAHPDVLALAGSWNAMLHPRNPAGSAGGGKFAKGSGGGAGKGGAKGAKGAGKGGAKGKGSAAAQAAAQAKIIAPQYMRMNPLQRAQFLATLSDPQLKALLHEVAQGNSADPSTRAALIAIKDQLAARSLTGAKGPTAVNQTKAAAAAKTAATQQAAAQKKTAAQTAAAKKATTTKPKAAPMKASHSLALAAPAVTSGDGPAVTVNGALTTPAHVRAAVKAHGKVPAALQASYRRKVIGAAKKMGALRHVPPAWLTGKGM